MPWRREKNSILRLEKKGKKDKSVWSIGYPNRPWPFIFIGWGGLIPQEILLQDLNLLKSLVVLGFHLDPSHRSTLPVRPVGCCRTDYSVWSVRPLGRTCKTGRYCRMPILIVNKKLMLFWTENSEGGPAVEILLKERVFTQQKRKQN